MIRLRPLKRKIRQDIMTMSTESFAERILGNYTLLQLQIQKEHFIHAVLSGTADERAENAGHSIFTQNIKIQQQTYLDIVNQLVNRIRLVEQKSQTYQDEVYVLTVLQKLGIKKPLELVQMTVRNMEIELQKHQLLKLSEEYRLELEKNNWISDQNKKTRRRRFGVKQPQMPEKQSSGFIDSICRRNQFVRTYPIWQEWMSDAGNTPYTPGEVFTELTENRRFINNLSALHLDETVFSLGGPEIAQSFGPFEKWILGKTNWGKEEMQATFISAVLYNLIRDTTLYTTEQESGFRRMKGGGFWLNLKEVLTNHTRQTAKHFFFCHRAMQATDLENQKELMNVIHEGFTREIRILNSIREISGKRKQEEERRELRKIRSAMQCILDERQTIWQEELLSQTARMLHAVTQIEEDIRRYVYDTEELYVNRRRWDTWETVHMVHVKSDQDLRNRTETKGDTSITKENGYLNQDVMLQDMNDTQRKNIRLDLAGQSKRAVSRMVRENIQEQMNTLTDKVYSRLEQKLQNERRRRGY